MRSVDFPEWSRKLLDTCQMRHVSNREESVPSQVHVSTGISTRWTWSLYYTRLIINDDKMLSNWMTSYCNSFKGHRVSPSCCYNYFLYLIFFSQTIYTHLRLRRDNLQQIHHASSGYHFIQRKIRKKKSPEVTRRLDRVGCVINWFSKAAITL